MTKHMESVHVEVGYLCDKCEYKSKEKDDLNTYKKLHDKEKSIKCNQCEKLFKSNEDMRQHIMSVHKGQPYYCD